MQSFFKTRVVRELELFKNYTLFIVVTLHHLLLLDYVVRCYCITLFVVAVLRRSLLLCYIRHSLYCIALLYYLSLKDLKYSNQTRVDFSV